ncbi:AtpZ/AtpI family protein [Pacificimonas sp. WHA3]|uniref:AtpZ/AtpI family protein n=1 Tax=Pacificimonas pallii TaxID=2827236 RepID=A0ABS6SFH7_9SPHN|nr:AtpZ/AtpI family protein [Pacificimonas pallii]MBV7257091.1 AtpZ/AtpI family protein [Pacificimonas pallii]
MSELTDPRNTESLEARLAAAKARANPEADPRAVVGNAFAQGTRLALELVAGILVGAALGYFLDSWLGSSPFGMIGGFLLGMVAGFVNLMRAVNQERAKVSQAEVAALPRVEDDDEESLF